jgi:hypothetical protein
VHDLSRLLRLDRFSFHQQDAWLRHASRHGHPAYNVFQLALLQIGGILQLASPKRCRWLDGCFSKGSFDAGRTATASAIPATKRSHARRKAAS